MEGGGYGTGEWGCMENMNKSFQEEGKLCRKVRKKKDLIGKVTKSVTFSYDGNEFSKNSLKQATLERVPTFLAAMELK